MWQCHPARGVSGASHASLHQLSPSLKSAGGLSPSGLQNKLLAGKKRGWRSSVCCWHTGKDLRAGKINRTGETGGVMNYCSAPAPLKEERESKSLTFGVVWSQGRGLSLLENTKPVDRHFAGARLKTWQDFRAVMLLSSLVSLFLLFPKPGQGERPAHFFFSTAWLQPRHSFSPGMLAGLRGHTSTAHF